MIISDALFSGVIRQFYRIPKGISAGISEWISEGYF